MASTEPAAIPRVDPERIRDAQRRLRPYLHWTPLVRSETLSREFGASVHLKLECLQKTGSFKPRGAFNKLLSLSPEDLARGVVGVSGGNHAQGLAYAASVLGVRATICMPSSTPQNYVDATRAYGAEILFADDIREAFAAAERLRRGGLVLVHPFDDLHVAEGQGTLGLEILHDLPTTTRIYVSIGGGGLIAGIAAAVKERNPNVKVIGVETRGADVMSLSVAAQELVELSRITSIARTLGAPKVSAMTLEHVNRLVDDLIVVEDDETVEALTFLLERTKTLVEPAAACCLAAARRQKADIAPDEQVVLLMCGGNVSLADLSRWNAGIKS
jgi:threonine dehydratase